MNIQIAVDIFLGIALVALLIFWVWVTVTGLRMRKVPLFPPILRVGEHIFPASAEGQYWGIGEAFREAMPHPRVGTSVFIEDSESTMLWGGEVITRTREHGALIKVIPGIEFH